MRAAKKLEYAVEAALTAMEAAGIPRSDVVVGAFARGSERYHTHVGNTRDGTYDDAEFLRHITRDLDREADRQAMAMFRKESCPSCGSPRWASMRNRRSARQGEKPGIYVDLWDECMDCGHKGPTR